MSNTCEKDNEVKHVHLVRSVNGDSHTSPNDLVDVQQEVLPGNDHMLDLFQQLRVQAGQVYGSTG